MAADVEALIVSFNSTDVIAECLSSLVRVAPGLPVAVREHGSDDAARQRLEQLLSAHPSPTRIDHDPSNPGFGAGCNALARSSHASWLLFLNPDTEVLAWPWNETRQPPRDQIVGPTMVGSGPPGDHSGVSYRIKDEIGRSWLRRRGPRPAGTGFVSGAALLIDAASFDRLGGFDESYFMYYEDIDLCVRANAAGIATTIDPAWSVHHGRAHSTRARFAESLTWSYESGSRFHASQGESLCMYRAYVVVDAFGRSALGLARRNRSTVSAYLSLARRAGTDLIRRRPVAARSQSST